MSSKAYSRIHKLRADLLLISLEHVDAGASNKDLAFVSGIALERIDETLRRLVTQGRIKRERVGGKRRIEVLGRPLVSWPKARQCGKSQGNTHEARRDKRTLEEIAGLPPNKRPRMRSCLRCGSLFKSEHAGNRMCNACKRDGPNITPFDFEG